MAKSQKVKVYHLYNINYDTDGEEVDLPLEALVMISANEDISDIGADLISDKTGFCVLGFNFKETQDYPKEMVVGSFYT